MTGQTPLALAARVIRPSAHHARLAGGIKQMRKYGRRITAQYTSEQNQARLPTNRGQRPGINKRKNAVIAQARTSNECRWLPRQA